MKHLFGRTLLAVMLYTAGAGFLSCKSKTDTGTTTDTASAGSSTMADTTVTLSAPPRVTISSDDSLNTKVKDATKDYPDVTTTVADGTVTLTGNITRAKLPNLMQAVQATHPKKVTNNLTIK